MIPAHLLGREASARYQGDRIVTETMHDRNKVMFMNAAAIVALPGGKGTLDELVEILTWRQLGLHEKPVYFVNTNGYWDSLIGLLNRVVEHRFADQVVLRSLIVVGSVDALMTDLRRRLS